jgi:hypothetical protein
MQFRFADPDESDLGIGKSVSKEEATEHNLYFDGVVLKENATKLKQKVELVEDSVKGVVNKVDDVVDKVTQTEQELADLKAQMQELKEQKSSELEPSGAFEVIDGSLTIIQDIDTLNNDYEEKQKEKIIEDYEKKNKGSINHRKDTPKKKGENKIVSGFKNGFVTVFILFAKLMCILFALLLIVVINYLINTSATPPDNLKPLMDFIRPGWDWLLDWIGTGFNYIIDLTSKKGGK